MKGPSLQKTTALSFALHLTFFIVAAVILRQSHTMIIPSPYVVDLIGPSESLKGQAEDRTHVRNASEMEAPEPAKQKDTKDKDARLDQQRINDRLAELKAKEKLKRFSDLKKKLVSIKGSEGKAQQANASQKPGGGPSKGTLFDSYYGKITDQIRQEWNYPGTEKDLEAIIAVKVAKDGTLTVQGIEKSSGNRLFDRAALQALAKASPVQPPPYEMEIGMRFYP
jgi:TolA protein